MRTATDATHAEIRSGLRDKHGNWIDMRDRKPPRPTAGDGGNGATKAGTVGHPARRADLKGGSDVLRFCESIRAHEMGGADAVREKAQEVYRGIIKASNWPFGINKRVAAVRMRRSLRKVANAMELSARSAAAARKTWTDVVGSGTRIAKSNGFDPTR